MAAVKKLVALDLCCCEGGMTRGFKHAGVTWVVGVDINPQPRYCGDEFHQADALEVLRILLSGGVWQGWRLEDFTFFHGSPPCQLYSDTQRLQGNDHPDLIAPMRELFEQTGKPWTIENVVGARDELRDPVLLCGTMFGLQTYRHRLFETNWPLVQPEHPKHVAPQAKMGRPPKPGEFIQCVGNFSGVAFGRQAMGMEWASRNGLREAVPPAYAEYVGRQLMVVLGE